MVDSNNAINDTVGASITGATNTFTLTNPSDTASSAARETITVGGASSGDPTINWNVAGVADWEMGIDNNDSDTWKLSEGTALGTTDSIRAISGGNILKPRSCSFSAYLSALVGSATGDGTIFTIICDTELGDVGGNYDNTTGVFTAPETGIYLLSGGINYINLGAAHAQLNSTVITTPIGFQFDSYSGNPFSNYTATGSTIVPLTAGDTATLTAQVSAGAKIVGINGGVGGGLTYFSGYLLG